MAPVRVDRNEIAASRDGRDIVRGWLSPLMLAPVDDRVLLERGGGDYRLYEEVLRDDHVKTAITQRAHGVIARDWKIEPGGARARDKAAADFLQETLEALQWDRITLAMLTGVYYGFSVAECLWARDGRFVRLAEVKVRNRRRFGFDGAGRLRLLTLADAMPGELMPERKFWVFRAGADHDDAPYGLGLAHYLYWPVWLKRNAWRFWATYLEKYAAPTALGKYPSGSSEVDKGRLLEALTAIQRDSAIIVPDGMLVELLEATRAGSVDYQGFINACNEAILLLCIGQTATAKGTPGSLGGEGERERVADAIIKADADLLCSSFSDGPARWLTEWNFPGAAVPRVWRVFEDEDLDAQVKREVQICSMGVARPTLKHIQDSYGGEWEAVEKQQPAAGPEATPQGEGQAEEKSEEPPEGKPEEQANKEPKEPPAFAEQAPNARRFTPDQQALEDLVAGVWPEGVAAAASLAGEIDAVIARATSFEDLRILLAAAMDGESPGQAALADALHRAGVAAELHGRDQLRWEQVENGGGDDA